MGETFAPAGETADGLGEGRPFTLPEEEGNGGWRNAFSWVLTIAVAVVATLLLRMFLFQPFSIPSPSMSPTLQVDDRVLVSKLSKDPTRGDVIVFDRPANDPPTRPDDPPVLIKRVIGLGGETVSGRDGRVYVDGNLIEEGYLPDGTVTDFPDGPIAVPQGSYLVMGDNRTNSHDGRNFGPIPKSLIVGRALLIFWPFNHAGSL